MFYKIMIALGIIATAVFLIVRVRYGGLPAMFCKAAASLCFIGTAFACFAYNHDEVFEYGGMVIFGLILSLLGDIWLDLKYVYPQHEKYYLYAGFISFMGGHTMFVPAIAKVCDFGRNEFIIAAAVSAVVTLGTLLLEKPMKLNYGAFRPISSLYAFFVTMTAASAAVGMVKTGFELKFIVFTVGAVAFLLSDLVLSSIYFKESGNTKVNVIVNHTLYYAAQFLIAATILL